MFKTNIRRHGMFSGKIIRRAFLKRTVFAFTGIFLGWTLYPTRRLFARSSLQERG
jgi:hypothetical protein